MHISTNHLFLCSVFFRCKNCRQGFGISHITKSGSQNGVLNVHSAKHSSSIAQKADKVMAIEGLRDEQIRIFKSLKSRDAENFSIRLEYIPQYFQFKEIQDLA